MAQIIERKLRQSVAWFSHFQAGSLPRVHSICAARPPTKMSPPDWAHPAFPWPKDPQYTLADNLLLLLSQLPREKSRRRQAGERRTPPGEGQASVKPGGTKGGLLSSRPLFHPPQNSGPHPGKRQVQDQVGGHGGVERDRDRGPVWWRSPSSRRLKAHPAFLCPPHLP